MLEYRIRLSWKVVYELILVTGIYEGEYPESGALSRETDIKYLVSIPSSAKT